MSRAFAEALNLLYRRTEDKWDLEFLYFKGESERLPKMVKLVTDMKISITQ